MSSAAVLLASGARDATICVFNVHEKTCRVRLTGHKAPVSGLAFLSGNQLVSSSLDHSLHLYDLTSGRIARTFSGEHDQAVTSVVTVLNDEANGGDASIIASASSDSSVRIWDTRASIPCVATMFDHDAAVYGLASFGPHGLISGSWDRTVRVWNLKMTSSDPGKGASCERVLKGHTDAVRSVVALDSTHIASAGWDRGIRIWDTTVEDDDEQACVGEIKSHSAWVYALAYLPEQQLLLSGSGDRTVRLSSPTEQRCVSVLTGHENTIWSVAALPSDPSYPLGRFASSGADGQIRLWDVSRGACTRIGGGHKEETSVNCLAVWSAGGASKKEGKPLVFKKQSTSTEELPLMDHPTSSSPLTLHTTHAFSSIEHSSHTKSSRTDSWSAAAAAPEGIVWTEVEGRFLNPDDPEIQAMEKAASEKGAANSQQAVDLSAVGSASTASPASASSSDDVLTQLCTLQPLLLSAYSRNDFGAALDRASSMLSLVEEEINRRGEGKQLAAGVSLASSSPSSLSPSSLSSLLFFLRHDVSLLHLRCFQSHSTADGSNHSRGEHARRALQAVQQAMAVYEDDEKDLSSSEESPLHTTKERESALKLSSSGGSRAARRIRRMLLETPCGREQSLEEVCIATSELAVEKMNLPAVGDNSNSSSAVSFSITRSSLYPALLLRRFVTALLSRSTPRDTPSAESPTASSSSSYSARASLELVFSAGAEVIGLVKETEQQREVILDEVECAALATTGPIVQSQLPLTTVYAHILFHYTTVVLPAVVHTQWCTIQTLKQQGNVAFAAIGTVSANAATESSTSSAQPESLVTNGAERSISGHSRLPSASSFSSTTGPPTTAAQALRVYQKALTCCERLSQLLGSSDLCPSWPWLQSILASPLPNPLLTGHATPPAWCRVQLDLVHATLDSNAAATALRCDSADPEGVFSPNCGAHKRARIHAEHGIDLVETLQRQCREARQAVKQAPKIQQVDSEEEDAENVHDDPTRIFLSHPSLLSLLPSDATLHALLSKLYFRHGSACFEMDEPRLEELANQSWALALRLQPDERVKRDIQSRKARREATKQQQAQQQQAAK